MAVHSADESSTHDDHREHDHAHDQSHRHGHDHDHAGAAFRAGERHRWRLVVAFGLVVGLLIAELVVGIAVGSLALLSDAGHMATDALGLGMALAAIHLASRNVHRDSRTFGLFRLEILSALMNSILLFGVAIYVFIEAVTRLGSPPEITTGPILVVGFLGLLVNVVSFFLLRNAAEDSLNVEGAYLEVLADLVGSVGVLVAAGVMRATGWEWLDPVVGIAIGLFILPRAWRLARKALRILIQAAPDHIDLDAVRSDLEAVDGVVDVHDLHVWTLTSDMEVLTAHVMVRSGIDHHAVLDDARSLLADRHSLSHATLQIEPENHEGCDDLTW